MSTDERATAVKIMAAIGGSGAYDRRLAEPAWLAGVEAQYAGGVTRAIRSFVPGTSPFGCWLIRTLRRSAAAAVVPRIGRRVGPVWGSSSALSGCQEEYRTRSFARAYPVQCRALLSELIDRGNLPTGCCSPKTGGSLAVGARRSSPMARVVSRRSDRL